MKILFTALLTIGLAFFSNAQKINSVLGQAQVVSVSDVSSIELVLRTGGQDAKDINNVQFAFTLIDENNKESVYKGKATAYKGSWRIAIKAPVASIYQIKAVATLSVEGFEKAQDWGMQFLFGSGTRGTAVRTNSRTELL